VVAALGRPAGFGVRLAVSATASILLVIAIIPRRGVTKAFTRP